MQLARVTRPVGVARPGRTSSVKVAAAWQKATTKSALQAAGGKVVAELGGQVRAARQLPLCAPCLDARLRHPPPPQHGLHSGGRNAAVAHIASATLSFHATAHLDRGGRRRGVCRQQQVLAPGPPHSGEWPQAHAPPPSLPAAMQPQACSTPKSPPAKPRPLHVGMYRHLSPWHHAPPPLPPRRAPSPSLRMPRARPPCSQPR